MGVYEELVERGLIAQVTDEEKIRDLVSSSPVVSLKSTAQKLGLDVRELNVLKQLQYDAVMPPVIIGK